MAQKVKPKKKGRFCDPAVCDYCIYIGEGDFICDKHIAAPDRVLVIDEWQPTENYLQCLQEVADGTTFV